MSFTTKTVAVPSEVAAGAAVNVDPRSDVVLGLSGTFTATVQFEYSPDASGSRWFSVGSALTAAGVLRLPAGRAKRVRANTTAYTSGTGVAVAFVDEALSATDKERQFEDVSLAVATSVAAAAATDLDGYQGFVTVDGTFVATVQLQFSLSESGDDWYNWGPAFTAAGSVAIPKGLARRVRVNTTAYTSGTPVVNLLWGAAVENASHDVETVTSGALSLFVETSIVSVTGTQAYTLADGWYRGQKKRVYVSVAASTPDGTLTPASFADGTSLDLDAVSESAELVWDGSAWQLTELNGATVTP